MESFTQRDGNLAVPPVYSLVYGCNIPYAQYIAPVAVLFEYLCKLFLVSLRREGIRSFRFRRLEAETVAVKFDAPSVKVSGGIDHRAVEVVSVTIHIIECYKEIAGHFSKMGLGFLPVPAEKVDST